MGSPKKPKNLGDMVGSKGKGRASASKSNSKNLALVCVEPQPLKSSIENSADDPLDREEDKEISNEREDSVCDEKRDEIICGTMVGEGHEEEQLASQVNDEDKDTANEMNVDRDDDVPSYRQTIEVSEEVRIGVIAAGVAENEGKINEVVPEQGEEHMQDRFSNKDIEAGVETKNLEVAGEGNVNISDGFSGSEHRIMEQELVNNVQNEEAEKVNAEGQGASTDSEKTECKGDDASIASDVKPVTQKVDRPRRKILKKKVVKKKVVVRDDAAPLEAAKLQSSIGDEASSELDKGTETGEEMKRSEVTAEEDGNVNEGLSATEHGIMEEKLADNMQNEEAKKVRAEEPGGTSTVNGKTECAGEDAEIADGVKSVTEKVIRPKRKVLKKKVVKKKVGLQDDVALVDEAKLQSSFGDEVSGKADKADASEDVQNEEKPVLADGGKIELTGDMADNVKMHVEKANGPKRTVLKKKIVKKKVVPGDSVASVNEAKPQSSIENDASAKANEAVQSKDVKNEDKLEVKPAVRVNKKRKRIRRKKVPQAHADRAIAADEQKPKVTNNRTGTKENKETDGKDVKTEETAKSEDRVSRLNKRKKKKKLSEDTRKVVTDSVSNPGPPRKSKSSERADGMGMIFMCSSETKKDCYRYKVLGLPASKKDIVSKIYKGMRLFLFDVDLRMMYGIYKATGPGGYNIEPRAFRSQFPSQVRFTILNDCLPLAEETFKKVIKDNYYTKNKFNCQLTNEQVKNLCKLFTEASRRAARTFIPAAPSSSSRDRKRKRTEDRGKARDTRKAGRADSREARHISPIMLERSRRRAHEEVRRAPIIIDDRYHHRPVVYERETYHPPALPAPVYRHLPPPSPPRTSSYVYDYEEASRVEIDIYRRDPALDHRRLDLSSSRDWERSVAAPSNLDPYAPYRETRAYLEPVYETSVRREAAYDTASIRPAEYYGAADYRPPLPPYRRY
ncbi:hypothetical protein Cgig2_003935 [Carnegiea gigantea]|uniref:DCD domain-containing protein n=1 Tax=Carnegiea gigantea TaxID=171969 RepID=A0A9Q1KBG0_9CARY|nr:hypothetical protein Cgig2_003935 [Carnegiea gigantea]